jgi:hypothetical protein
MDCETIGKGRLEVPDSNFLGCNIVASGKWRLAGEDLPPATNSGFFKKKIF